ncbi:hypothetical protein ES319_D11G140300v1 [Gossypium barbadense]|uniref:Uncharacterized protein n=2 Tax=Gossypium TaxID=3633 RepID=A0A5J5PB05_GOSBA|nr:hypothetical protein ES319_D11G140300v1 [Gossypium barbadense]TYG45095.1 hypothetical protein ES288_D11G147900v1 [Gossypium darwinii]
MTEKKSWPELVGTNGESAKETIERENRNVKAVVLLDGSPATMDFRRIGSRFGLMETGWWFVLLQLANTLYSILMNSDGVNNNRSPLSIM